MANARIECFKDLGILSANGKSLAPSSLFDSVACKLTYIIFECNYCYAASWLVVYSIMFTFISLEQFHILLEGGGVGLEEGDRRRGSYLL